MKDVAILRDLAKRYIEISSEDIQNERRDLWRQHNSLKPTRLLIYARAFGWNEMPESKLKCTDPFFVGYEYFFRLKLFWHSLNDDSIFEPWVSMPASYKYSGWGVDYLLNRTDDSGGAYKETHPIENYEEDMQKLITPSHEIDEKATAKNLSKLHNAIGDIITINLDRSSAYRMWGGDISTHIGHLRGIEPIMYDMMDQPENLHKLLAFLRDSILRVYEQAEAAGDFGFYAHENQAMTYAEELEDPAPNTKNVKLNQLWGYAAAQEYTLISPEMHDEFLLQYQLPILKKFGLTAYGCCEDLTNKIDILRQIPNLRRIAVSPFADPKKCAEQIGGDYVISYRPNPSTTVSCGFDPARIKSDLTRDLQIFKANGCQPDITLKDVESVENDPNRVREWVKLNRHVIDKVW
jgi:hypothetical protein